jgi:hypothetical protein
VDLDALACARQGPGLSDLTCSGMTGMGLQMPRERTGPRPKKRPAASPHATSVGYSRAGPLWSSRSGTSRLARDFAYRLLEQWQNIAFQFQIEHGTCSGVVQLADSPAFHHEDVVHAEAHPADGEGELIRN